MLGRLPLLLTWVCSFLLVQGYEKTTVEVLKALPEPGSDFDIHDGSLLSPILKPRVPGTKGSREVLQHFVDFFDKNLPDWKVELHNTTMDTALGKKLPFVNFIATRDPPWTQPGQVGRLALTAHYDSLIKPEGFIGAIDSAAPCAMIMHIVRSIDAALTKKWQEMEARRDPLDDAEEKGIQVILFDGEEAFVHWTDDDSIYGSRALAEYWEDQPYSAMSTFQNPMRSISLFVLLDLLGAKEPRIPSYFGTTHWAYGAMSDIEMRLRSNGLFKSSPNHRLKRAPDANGNLPAMRAESLWLYNTDKKPDAFGAPFMGDDHVPFLAAGVQVLHLIPTPFPTVWHNMDDDGEHLDSDTVEDWAKLVLGFTVEWLEIGTYMSQQEPHAKRSPDKSEL